MASRASLSGSTVMPLEITDDDAGWESDSTLDEPNCCDPTPLRRTAIAPDPPWVMEDCHLTQPRKILVKVGDVVELTGGMEYSTYWDDRNGDFLLIKRILRNLRTNETKLMGYRLRRHAHLSEILSSADDTNEVCLLIPPSSSCFEEVRCDQVFKTRSIKFTNLLFPEMSARAINPTNAATPRISERHLRDSGVLVCRWVFSPAYLARELTDVPMKNGTLRRLTMLECNSIDAHNAVTISDDQMLMEHLRHLPTNPRPGTKRTCVDLFCGAGGIGEGAKRAGFIVTKAVDIDRCACDTNVLNHPDTEVYQASVEQFFVVAFPHGSQEIVDVVHISPVCKTFSPAHTRRGRNDERNQATLFVVDEALKLIRPRVLCIEQTSGILTHHPVYFKKLINMITSVGYSVRWKVVRLDEHGAPQRRKRLIIYASCPGGSLPEFPRPSHGPLSEFNYPFTAVKQALAPLRTARNITCHDVVGATRRFRSRRVIRRRARLYAPLRYCITTQGPAEYHPTEERDFTIREAALLAGFPVGYKFIERQGLTAIMTQIGNAVPPVAAEELLREIHRTLDREDRARAHL